MSRRYLYAVRFLIAGAVFLLGVHGAAGQVTDAVAEAVKNEAWDQPRTPWGDPDLQGIWNNTAWNATPLEFKPRRTSQREKEEGGIVPSSPAPQALAMTAISGVKAPAQGG